MDLPLTIRDFDPADLAELSWAGGPSHLDSLVADLPKAYAGEVVQLVVVLPTGRLVGFGAANLPPGTETGTLKQLDVHELLQGLGIGTRLVRALEERVAAAGRTTVEIGVEHDNPRAAALYRRLGYAEAGAAVESWSIGSGQTYVTVISLLRRRLA